MVYDHKADLDGIFQAGIKSVHAGRCIRNACHLEKDNLTVSGRCFDLNAYSNIYVAGAGKATAAMALALEEILEDRINDGIISVKYGHTAELKQIKMIEAGHPIPDQNGCRAAGMIMELADRATEGDLFICLFSGGGSALMPLPVAGVSLEDKQTLTQLLLSCGADIHEINTLRRCLSQVKGGGLATAVYPATLVTLMISDVIGDSPEVIASGPTVAAPDSYREAAMIIKKYSLENRVPSSVMNYLKASHTSVGVDVKRINRVHNVVIGSGLTALEAAKKEAEKRGYNTMILSSVVDGDTTIAAGVHAAIAREVLNSGNPVTLPACILSGGETTVVVKGQGRGGRNTEFALSMALMISGLSGVSFLSAGTDGTDGDTDAAGAICDSTTVTLAEQKGLSAVHYLDDNDSWHFFKALDDLVVTGPTDTNVMDLRVLLIG